MNFKIVFIVSSASVERRVCVGHCLGHVILGKSLVCTNLRERSFASSVV